MKALMKSAFMMLVLCLTSNGIFAQGEFISQDNPPYKMTVQSDKDELIKKYPWVKSHFVSKKNTLTKVSEILSNGNQNFVMIETDNDKILYDTYGNTYCTDLESLYRSGFHKLRPGELHWTRS
jgi:hypothetical protein